MRDRVRWSERPYGGWPAARARGRDDEVKGFVHTLVCPACHAILQDNTWFVDEERYGQLDGRSGVWPTLCPGCLRVARGTYKGEVILRSRLLVLSKSAALDLISNEEERARCNDPLSRLTAVEDYGDEIKVLTTTPVLAERIGRAFRRVYEGQLEIQDAAPQDVRRVLWHR